MKDFDDFQTRMNLNLETLLNDASKITGIIDRREELLTSSEKQIAIGTYLMLRTLRLYHEWSQE